MTLASDCESYRGSGIVSRCVNPYHSDDPDACRACGGDWATWVRICCDCAAGDQAMADRALPDEEEEA